MSKNKTSAASVAALTHAFFRSMPANLGDAIFSVSSQGIELFSVGSAICWIIPLVLHTDFMNTTVYLRAIAEHAPRLPFMLCLIALGVFQWCALMMPRPPKVQPEGDGGRSNGESIVRSKQAIKWLKYRRVGSVAAVVGWAFMSYAASTVIFTPGTGWFILLFLFSLVGGYKLDAELVAEEKILRDLESDAESKRCLREHNILPGVLASIPSLP